MKVKKAGWFQKLLDSYAWASHNRRLIAAFLLLYVILIISGCFIIRFWGCLPSMWPVYPILRTTSTSPSELCWQPQILQSRLLWLSTIPGMRMNRLP